MPPVVSQLLSSPVPSLSTLSVVRSRVAAMCLSREDLVWLSCPSRLLTNECIQHKRAMRPIITSKKMTPNVILASWLSISVSSFSIAGTVAPPAGCAMAARPAVIHGPHVALFSLSQLQIAPATVPVTADFCSKSVIAASVRLNSVKKANATGLMWRSVGEMNLAISSCICKCPGILTWVTGCVATKIVGTH